MTLLLLFWGLETHLRDQCCLHCHEIKFIFTISDRAEHFQREVFALRNHTVRIKGRPVLAQNGIPIECSELSCHNTSARCLRNNWKVHWIVDVVYKYRNGGVAHCFVVIKHNRQSRNLIYCPARKWTNLLGMSDIRSAEHGS